MNYRFEANSLMISGEYETVSDGILEYTWNWHVPREPVHDATYRLTIRFEGDGQQSTLHVRQEGFENQDHIQPHEKGWNKALEQLQQFLAGDTGAGSVEDDNATTAAEQKAVQSQSGEQELTEADRQLASGQVDSTANGEAQGAPQHPPISGYMETPEQQKVGGG